MRLSGTWLGDFWAALISPDGVALFLQTLVATGISVGVAAAILRTELRHSDRASRVPHAQRVASLLTDWIAPTEWLAGRPRDEERRADTELGRLLLDPAVQPPAFDNYLRLDQALMPLGISLQQTPLRAHMYDRSELWLQLGLAFSTMQFEVEGGLLRDDEGLRLAGSAARTQMHLLDNLIRQRIPGLLHWKGNLRKRPVALREDLGFEPKSKDEIKKLVVEFRKHLLESVGRRRGRATS